mmetsp:Transcript_15445/g.60381  ORF Transcript_15445/g.60381 Transcript_15445/m.60381 type:complete len:764 (-) Transcript_15445:40-2331(-)
MVYQQKGGIWKNTEDEILKAAVMKYGLNQWARISSLLVRKSASQCKARWYEWLDPGIKKTEWSREEEERLLHLAKLMPTQWRTIAPLVGRTVAQCIEHYDKLLDAAQQRDESYDPEDDPRRLRSGEVDPNPETKPARPDPIDMDEDEKEMLQEARARLANTRGKKAKRKAREKQLEQAKRVAALQKRRELKAAGIAVTNRKKKRKKRGIDYNDEIPFYMEVPAGFHEAEEHQAAPSFKQRYRSELEEKRRSEVEENLRKQDIKKQREREKKNLPAVVMQTNKLNDPQQVRNYNSLKMPAPQISESELEELAKLNKAGGAGAAALAAAEDNSATSALLSSYRSTPATGTGRLAGKTPVRTPARPDTVMMEAQNLIALSSQRAPLLGGENTPLTKPDFSGAAPEDRTVATPNRFARQSSVGATPLATPVRDQLSINDSLGAVAESSAVAERHRQAAQGKQLLSALKSLPAPKNTYQVVLPELPSAPEGDAMDVVDEEDRGDIEERQRREDELMKQELLLQRSQPLQRELPRSTVVSLPISANANAVSALINEELEYILRHDAIHYPLPAHKKLQLPAREAFDVISQPALDTAAAEIEKETAALQESEKSAVPSQEEFTDTLLAAWDAVHGDEYLVQPASGSRGRLVRTSELSEKEQVECLQFQFNKHKEVATKMAERASKLERKVTVYNKGYAMRNRNILAETAKNRAAIDLASTELACFEALHINEQHSVNRRLEALHEEVNEQIEREKELQQRYASLRLELAA